MREKMTCRDCEKISEPPAPFHVTPRGRAGPNLLAMLLFEKFGQYQPLNRQAERYGREGVPLALSTLAAMYSLIITAKMNNIDPQAWLADVLPWNWRAERAAVNRAASKTAHLRRSPDAYTELAALGREGLKLWREAFHGLPVRGSLVVAARRDRAELNRFARMTSGHRTLSGDQIAAVEPMLGGRVSEALFFDEESHLAPRQALSELVEALRILGVALHFGTPVAGPIQHVASGGGIVIDCRGMAARDVLTELRGVRGEMIVVQLEGARLSRPIRLLHPRYPIYVVPWGDDRYMVGATMIESEDGRPVTVRSAIDLLGTACALHPSFADARIEEISSCVRPSLPNNMPRIVVRGRRLIVNGAYRHGYLLAPVLARAAARAVLNDRIDPRLMPVP